MATTATSCCRMTAVSVFCTGSCATHFGRQEFADGPNCPRQLRQKTFWKLFIRLKGGRSPKKREAADHDRQEAADEENETADEKKKEEEETDALFELAVQ
ncbi:unnamed protein product [Polarella glacialis]|uniref:Uncharacterized protein n=1 Tax=Polarella glacialis TaxID=89957 RepID=A0A813FBD0_POLGL|nr:unnamed protein product [Polarella glacialis]